MVSSGDEGDIGTPDSGRGRSVSPEVLTIAACVVWLGVVVLTRLRESIVIALIPPVVLSIVALIIAQAFRSRRRGDAYMRRLGRRRVEVREGYLAASDARGRPLGRIDLGQEYEVTIPWAGNGEGVYRVTQGDVVVEFSSQLQQAEHLVKDVLHHPVWPPDAYLTWM